MSSALVGADGFLRLKGWSPEEEIPKDYSLQSRRLRRSYAACHAGSSGQHLLLGADVAGADCPPLSSALVGAGGFLRLTGWSPEEKIPKDYYLRSRRLRRSYAARHTPSSGQHSLSGVDVSCTGCPPMSSALVGADGFLRLKGCSQEEEIPKDYYLQSRRLRRSSAARHVCSSGQHLLPGADVSGTR